MNKMYVVINNSSRIQKMDYSNNPVFQYFGDVYVEFDEIGNKLKSS